MKVINDIALCLFSVIMIIISIVLIILTFGWVEFNYISQMIETIIQDDLGAKAIFIFSILFILLGIKCIFFDSNKDKDGKEGILLENDNGQLLISKETLENLANSVVNTFEGPETITTKIVLDKENNLIINIILTVKPNVIIKDLSNNLQEKVKESIKKASDLEVKEVNVKIKNIAQKREN